VLVGTWTRSINRDRVERVLACDETTMCDELDVNDNPNTLDFDSEQAGEKPRGPPTA